MIATSTLANDVLPSISGCTVTLGSTSFVDPASPILTGQVWVGGLHQKGSGVVYLTDDGEEAQFEVPFILFFLIFYNYFWIAKLRVNLKLPWLYFDCIYLGFCWVKLPCL
jgi:hypothetical protein